MAYALGNSAPLLNSPYQSSAPRSLLEKQPCEEVTEKSDINDKKHIYFKEGKLEVSDHDAELLVLDLKKPFAQMSVDMEKGQKSRFQFLSEQSKKLDLHFVAMPIDKGDVFDPPQSVLKTSQTCLSCRHMGGVLERFETSFSNNRAIIVNSFLDSGHADWTLLPHLKVPPSAHIQEVVKLADDNWPVATEANSINIFMLAEFTNRPIVFFNPNQLEGKGFIVQLPDLTCGMHSLEEIFETVDISKTGRPIWVTSDPSHLYIFQDKKNKPSSYQTVVKSMFALVIKPAFKENYGGRHCEEKLYLKSSDTDRQIRYRIIPTFSGPIVQSFDVKGELYDIHSYKLYLYSLAKQIANEKPDDIPLEQKMSQSCVLGRKAAHSERELSNSVERLYSSHNKWLIKVAIIKRYALTGESELNIFEIKSLLEDVQREFKEQTNSDVKYAMFDLLAEIPYENRILDLSRADAQASSWLKRLRAVKAADAPNGSVINDEEFKTLHLGLITLRKITDFKDCDKFSQRIEAMIGVLVKLTDNNQLSEADFTKYYPPLVAKLESLKVLADREDIVDSADICDQLVQVIAKEEAPNQTFIAKPKSASDMGRWLQKHGNLKCLSENQRNMLEANKDIIFDILQAAPQELERCIKNYMQEVRRRSYEKGYTANEIDMFPHIVKELYSKSHPLKILDSDLLNRYSRLLPALKIEILSMLWPSAEEMEHQIKTSLTAIASEALILSEDEIGLHHRKKQVVLKKADLKQIASGLTTNFTDSGRIELYYKGGSKQLLSASLLTETAKRFSEGTPIQVLRSCLTEYPTGFMRTWGKYNKPSKKTHI